MRRFASILAVLALLLALAPPASAAPIAHRVILYEGDLGSGDGIVFNGSDADLNNNVHTQPGDCARDVFDPEGNDWNNCADSVRVYLLSNECLRLYNGANYSSHLVTYAGPQQAILRDGFLDDAVSSFLFTIKSSSGAC